MDHWKQGLVMIPDYMRDAVIRYVEYGIEGGSFLNAVLSNDFKGVVGRADHTNLRYLKEWAELVYWYLPSECQGSRENVVAWIARGGLRGSDVQLTDNEESEETHE